MADDDLNRKRNQRKIELRQNILDVAREIFLNQGYEAISIRKIADALSISPTTIYLYYKDKGAVIYALHLEGFKTLFLAFGVLQAVDEPFERLKAMGRSYLNFAVENPAFYELMFVYKEPLSYADRNCNEERQGGGAAFGALLDTVQACKTQGYFKTIDGYSLALFVWTAVHGICSLKLQGHIDHAVKKYMPATPGYKELDNAYETLVTMIKNIK